MRITMSIFTAGKPGHVQVRPAKSAPISLWIWAHVRNVIKYIRFLASTRVHFPNIISIDSSVSAGHTDRDRDRATSVTMGRILCHAQRYGMDIFPRTLIKIPNNCKEQNDSKYTVSQKNKTLNSCPYLSQMLTDFQNSFASRLGSKFATNAYSNSLLHLMSLH